MEKRQLKKLRRAELIEIIYLLETNERALQQEIEDLKQKLSDRNYILQNAGSLAEAVMSIHAVVDTVQAAADDYLLGIQNMYEQARIETARILGDSQEHAQLPLSAEKQAAETPCPDPITAEEAE